MFVFGSKHLVELIWTFRFRFVGRIVGVKYRKTTQELLPHHRTKSKMMDAEIVFTHFTALEIMKIKLSTFAKSRFQPTSAKSMRIYVRTFWKQRCSYRSLKMAPPSGGVAR